MRFLAVVEKLTGEPRPGKLNGKSHDTSHEGNAPWLTEGEWIYQDADEKPYLKVVRKRKPDGSKSYPQFHWDGGKWVTGKPAGSKIPYRFPELLDADRTEPVWITEGEKCADRLAKEGFAVTTASEGAGKWTADLNQYFAGRIVWILPDEDEPGRRHAQQVAAHLHGVASEVRIVEIPGLKDGQDVHDFLDGSGTAEQLRQWAEEAPLWVPQKDDTGKSTEATVLPRIQWINMSNWDSEPRPEREWGVPNRIPLLQAALFSGEGAAGKSSVQLHLCVAHVLAKDWLGTMPAPGPAFFIEAEDDAKELHRRLGDICDYYGVKFNDVINGGLHLKSFAGEEAMLAVANQKGKIEATPLYKELLEEAGNIKPKMIGIASSANVFAGNENDRAQVQQFASLLTRLAIVANGSVVLIGHPSLTGINTGTGLSGTTQWHNAFRARFYMTSAKPESGEQPDDDLREIVFKKNQYGKKAETIVLRYQRGMYLPVPKASSLEKVRADAEADDAFLKCLDEFTAQGRRPSSNRGPTYAPTVFAESKVGKTIGKIRLKDAMDRLFEAETIKAGRNPDLKASKSGMVILRQQEATEAATKSSATARRGCAKPFLLEILAGGPRLGTEIQEVAKANLISVRTLQRAKDELGIVVEKSGFADGWMWKLPEGKP